MKNITLPLLAIFISALSMIISITGCNPSKPKADVITIKRNKHYMDGYVLNRRKAYDNNYMTFAFKFDNSARYKFPDDPDQHDWCKLFGFSYGSPYPGINSARFVWRYDTINKNIQIGAYSYTDHIKTSIQLGTVEIGEIACATLEDRPGAYVYKFKGKVAFHPKTAWGGKRYYQFPYFGGNKKAPHKIKIYLWYNK